MPKHYHKQGTYYLGNRQVRVLKAVDRGKNRVRHLLVVFAPIVHHWGVDKNGALKVLETYLEEPGYIDEDEIRQEPKSKRIATKISAAQRRRAREVREQKHLKLGSSSP
jgi:hypothetical protein